MAKQGTEYEIFIKDVYECLNRADGLDDIQIQHDVKLTGAAGTPHQIDVFWSFRKGGVDYKVAIECKDYKSHISKEKIAAFHAILHDIGNIHGIYVSKMGFQSGAVLYAQKYGIQLMEIRRPIEKDWEGRIKDIHVDLCLRTNGEFRTRILVNKKRADEMGIVLPEDSGFQAFSGDVKVIFGEMQINDREVVKEGSKTMADLINTLPTDEPGKDRSFTYAFRDATIFLNDMDLPVDGIQFTYNTYEYNECLSIYGEDSIKAIVKNITDGTESHIDEFGRVSIRENI